MARLQEAQTIFQDTGGTHAVALASPDGKVFIHAEDVGRHNAMDKVIGRAVLTRARTSPAWWPCLAAASASRWP